MAVRFVKGGLQSYQSPFEKSKLGQAVQQAQKVKKGKGGGGGGIPTGEAEEVMEKLPSKPIISISDETARYQKLGYTKDEARILAEASAKQGGMTFTPQKSQQILNEKLRLGGGVVFAYQKPTEKEIVESEKLSAGMKIKETVSKGARGAKEFIRRLGLGAIAEKVTAPRDVLVSAFTGIPTKEEAEVPTIEKVLAREAREKTAYYTRPTYTGKINFAGELPIFKLTVGEELSKGIFTEDVSAFVKENVKVKENINKAQEEINKIYNDYQARVEAGEDLDKVNLEYQKASNKIQEKYVSITNSELKKISYISNTKRKELIKDYENKLKTSVPQRILYYGLTFGSWSIPVVGQVFKFADITKMAEESPQYLSSLYEKPVSTLAETGLAIGTGIATGMVISGIKTSIVNTRLKAEALARQRQLKLGVSYSIQVGNAVKAGTDYLGNPIWNVEVKSLSKIINKKTGEVLDRIKSIATVKAVTALTEEGAVKSTIDAMSMELRRGGVRNYVSENKITVKADLGKIRGEAFVKPTAIEDLFAGYGKFDITQGKMKIKAVLGEVRIKANLENLPRSSALSNFLIQKGDVYPEVKILGKGVKVKGVEEIYKSLTRTDIYKDILKVKGYERTIFEKGFPETIRIEKIKSYYRKIGKEGKPLKDLTKGYLKSFTPEEMILNLKGYEFEKPQVPKLKFEVSKKVAAEVSAQVAIQARMTAITKNLIGEIKTTPIKIETGKIIKAESILASVNKAVVAGLTGVRLTEKQFGKVEVPIIKQERGIRPYYPNKELYLPERTELKTRTIQKEKLKVMPLLLPLQDLALENALMGKQETRLKQAIIPRQALQQKSMQRQMQQQAQKIVTILSSPLTPSLPPSIPAPKLVFETSTPFIVELPKRKKGYYKIKKITGKLKLKKQRRAYQPSVAAVQLGIYEKPKKIKAIEKYITGMEIRPQILIKPTREMRKENFEKKLNRLFS